jgi:molybdopterin converting factor small subunit
MARTTTRSDSLRSESSDGGIGVSGPAVSFPDGAAMLAPRAPSPHTPVPMGLSGTAPPTIRVRLFARYAELLGAESLDLPAAGLATAGDVLARVRALPGGAAVGGSTLMAVNLRQATLDTRVGPGDEVAVLPPLAGG